MSSTKIYTPELIASLKKLGDNFEAAIRADERQRLLAKFRQEFPVTGASTDMHGEPLAEEFRPQPKRKNKPATRAKLFRSNSKRGRVYRELASSTLGLNSRTLMARTGLSLHGVHCAISSLRTEFKVPIVSYRKAGWIRPKYKIASAA